MTVKLSVGEYFGEDIRNQDHDFFRCNITRYDASASIGMHYHENSYLSLLLNGSYREINKKEDILVEPGSVVYRPSCYTHSNAFHQQGGHCFNIEFKKGCMEMADWKLPLKNCKYPAGNLRPVYDLYRHFINGSNSDQQWEMVIEWMAELNGSMHVASRLPWVSKVKYILDNETGIHHSIHSISQRVFVHPVYLARAFKIQTGCTIGDYQMKIKLEKAVALLFNSSLPMHEIAWQNGFADAAHFIRCFKMAYHISPLQFRKAVKS
jgi:AraC family transcriptional regulator